MVDDHEVPQRSRLATRAVHNGGVGAPAERPAAPPIYQTSTFAFDDADDFIAALAGPDDGFVYSRLGNPTTAALERSCADLEDGAGALAFASGMAAVSTTVMAVAAGGRVVAQRDCYGGTSPWCPIRRAPSTASSTTPPWPPPASGRAWSACRPASSTPNDLVADFARALEAAES